MQLQTRNSTRAFRKRTNGIFKMTVNITAKKYCLNLVLIIFPRRIQCVHIFHIFLLLLRALFARKDHPSRLLSRSKTRIAVPISIIHQLTSHVCFSALINGRIQERPIFPAADRTIGDCVISRWLYWLELREHRVFSVWPTRKVFHRLFASVRLTSRRASRRALHVRRPLPSFFISFRLRQTTVSIDL